MFGLQAGLGRGFGRQGEFGAFWECCFWGALPWNVGILYHCRDASVADSHRKMIEVHGAEGCGELD